MQAGVEVTEDGPPGSHTQRRSWAPSNPTKAPVPPEEPHPTESVSSPCTAGRQGALPPHASADHERWHVAGSSAGGAHASRRMVAGVAVECRSPLRCTIEAGEVTDRPGAAGHQGRRHRSSARLGASARTCTAHWYTAGTGTGTGTGSSGSGTGSGNSGSGSSGTDTGTAPAPAPAAPAPAPARQLRHRYRHGPGTGAARGPDYPGRPVGRHGGSFASSTAGRER